MAEPQPKPCLLCVDYANRALDVVYNQMLFACENCNSAYEDTSICVYFTGRVHKRGVPFYHSTDLRYDRCPKCDDGEARIFKAVTRWMIKDLALYYVCSDKSCMQRSPICWFFG